MENDDQTIEDQPERVQSPFAIDGMVSLTTKLNGSVINLEKTWIHDQSETELVLITKAKIFENNIVHLQDFKIQFEKNYNKFKDKLAGSEQNSLRNLNKSKANNKNIKLFTVFRELMKQKHRQKKKSISKKKLIFKPNSLMKPKIAEEKTPVLKHLFTRINEIKQNCKFKSYGSYSQAGIKEIEVKESDAKFKLLSTSFRFFSSSCSPRPSNDYASILSSNNQRKTVYSGIANHTRQESEIGKGNDYIPLGTSSSYISRSLKNCSGRSSQTDQANFNFHVYIQNELFKRRNKVTEKEKSEPITRIIVRDLNKNVKDPLSINSSKQFQKIRFGKFKDA